MQRTLITVVVFNGILMGSGCQTPQGLRDISVTRAKEDTTALRDGVNLKLSDQPTPSRWANKSQDKAARASLSDLETSESKPVNNSLALRDPTPETKPQEESKEILGAFQGSDPKIRESAERQLAAALSLPKQQAAESPVSSPTKVNTPTDSPIQQVTHTEPAKDSTTKFGNTDSSLPLEKKSTPSASPTRDEDVPVELLVTKLIDRLASDSSDSNNPDFRLALTHAVLLALQGRLDDASNAIPGLDDNEAQYFRQQFKALAILADEKGPPGRSKRYALALPELREATNHLGAATGALSVSTPVFCSEVESYGSITRFKHDRFNPGQQVILYCEVDHFVAEKISSGFETQLQGGYELFDDKGVKVAEQTLPEDKQVCEHFRRDYFIAYRMYLPNHLEPGTYRLRLTMEDHKGKLYGQSETKFDIVKTSK